MPLTFKSDFEQKVSKLISQAQKQARFAGAKSLTQTAQSLKKATEGRMAVRFKSPTRWTMNSIYMTPANKETMTAVVGVKDVGSGAGRAPDRWLRAEYRGGLRVSKSFERSFQKAGIMPAGWFAVPGGGIDAVGAMDGHGNIKSTFLVMLIKYFNAFKDGGFKKNMTDRSRKAKAKYSTGSDGKRVINGWVFFVSTGDRRTRHLSPGIWAKKGVQGTTLHQVISFRSSLNEYSQAVDMRGDAEHLMRTEFLARFEVEFPKAMATAR